MTNYKNLFLTNYTEQTFLDRIRENLRTCKEFVFSVSFIKKAGLVLLIKDIEAALSRGVKGKLITSIYQNFTDIKSLRSFLRLMELYETFECHLDFESIHDDGYMTIGYHSKGYFFAFGDYSEVITGSSNITRYALLKNVEWDLVVHDTDENPVFGQMLSEFDDKWSNTFTLDKQYIKLLSSPGNASDHFWELEMRIKRDRKHPGVIIELRKSEAIWVIAMFVQKKAIKMEDLEGFSDDLIEAVKLILSR